MGAVYIIFALAAGLLAGVFTYSTAGLLWAFAAYCVAGALGVFALALVRVMYAGRGDSVCARGVRSGNSAEAAR